jgi:hypothetical protein
MALASCLPSAPNAKWMIKLWPWEGRNNRSDFILCIVVDRADRSGGGHLHVVAARVGACCVRYDLRYGAARAEIPVGGTLFKTAVGDADTADLLPSFRALRLPTRGHLFGQLVNLHDSVDQDGH